MKCHCKAWHRHNTPKMARYNHSFDCSDAHRTGSTLCVNPTRCELHHQSINQDGRPGHSAIVHQERGHWLTLEGWPYNSICKGSIRVPSYMMHLKQRDMNTSCLEKVLIFTRTQSSSIEVTMTHPLRKQARSGTVLSTAPDVT